MTQSTKQIRQSESGFTLVELAIVMIIIGLLIGGILKGQELITNARVSATIAQIKAVESGISGFRDKYNAMPADMLNPVAQIPNCAGLCAVVGNGDGLVQGATANNPGAANAASEAANAFVALGAAGFVGGVNGAATVINTALQSNPDIPVGGGWHFGYGNGAVVTTGATSGAAVPQGHYMISALTLGTAMGAANAAFTPAQAATIDRKVDDGNPNSGIVRAGGAIGAGNCASLATADGIYQEATTARNCGLFARVQ